MKRILLAVSGGVDSMFMLARAEEFFPGSEVAVAHCNFGLRGDESDGDETFVRRWCEEHGIRCYVRRFDTAAYASQEGISIEMAARDLRYGWFSALMDEQGFDAVAVAHNADDNAETLILNLLRGTGTRGLRGMSDRALGKNGQVLRPLLGISRAEISDWMKAAGIPHREDSTNAETLYRRNKIRHEVFPVFEQINPSFRKTFATDMKHFAQVDDIASDYVAAAAERVLMPGGPAEISIPGLLNERHGEYLLFRLLEEFGFDEATVSALYRTIAGGGTVSGKSFESGAWKAVTSNGRISVMAKAETKEWEVEITGEGVFRAGERTVTVRTLLRPAGLELKRPSGQLVADADKLPFPIKVRNWRDGDWIRPLGLGGKKKLSDLFVDLKWGYAQKAAAIVLEHPDGQPGHVGALLCERISDSLKVTPDTKNIIEINIDY